MKILELKEKESEDLKRQKITDLKEMTRFKNEINQLKQEVIIVKESAMAEQSSN